jgi:hypothetical protein
MVSLKPQDVIVAVRVALRRGSKESYAELARGVQLSTSEVHSSVFRLGAAGLIDIKERRPRVANLLEFLEHGVRYAFVSDVRGVTRGVPTAHSAPPLSDEIASAPSGPLADLRDVPIVWAHPEGTVRGESLEPLYPSAVDAALMDPALHEGLALVDAIRIGRSRERTLAIGLLRKKFGAR